RDDAVKTEAVVDSFLVAAPDQMQVRERVSERAQMGGVQIFHRQLDAVHIARHRDALALKFQMVSAALGLERLRAGEILLAQVKQQLEFLFYFKLALYLIDFGEKFRPLGFDQIMRVDRARARACE